MENIEKGEEQQQIAKFHLSYDPLGIVLTTLTLHQLLEQWFSNFRIT